jgi:hypothetical protein
MQNLINGLKTTSFFVLFTSAFLAQENKYTRKNKDAEVIQYTSDKCYSRSILIKENIVYTANSNGSMYATDLQTKLSFNLLQNKKFEEMRDLEFSGNYLYGMQSGTYGLLAKTNGKKFIDYITPTTSIWIDKFLDGMDFYGETGFIMGDPKNGIFSLYFSIDGGNSWKECEGKIENFEDEAGFAASGTNVQVMNDSTFIFVSGGKKSRFFKSTDKGKSWVINSLPYLTSESSGAFSICMISEKIGVIVGGDYSNPDLCLNTCFYTDDGGKFWLNSEEQPRGYRSCVIHAANVFYACGTNGIDFSTDNGYSWKPYAHGNFFSLAADEKKLYATTINGSFQVFDLIQKK